MSKVGILAVMSLSLALAVATPAFAAGLHNDGTGYLGSGGYRTAQVSIDSVASKNSDAFYCAQRWAYHDAASGKYMGDDGEWRTCR
jgi:hypothetical protein